MTDHANSERVLVGIATRNRAAVLEKTLRSVLEQRGAAIRISVIDDGSSDATPSLQSKFPTVEWIRWDPSRGYMTARNHWMNSAQEQYFVSLDDDAWFLAGDEIAQALQVIRDNPRTAAIAFDILSPDRPESSPRRPFQQTASFIGCGHMLRLYATRQVGGYEKSPGDYGVEEKDLCLRLMNAGYEIVRLPGVHVWHDKSPLARESSAQMRSGVCNDLVMAVRRTPAFLLPGALSMKVYRHLAFGIRNHAVAPVLEGFWMFFKEIPKIWKSRKAVKASTLRRFMRLRT